jgi:hypothetical protein
MHSVVGFHSWMMSFVVLLGDQTVGPSLDLASGGLTAVCSAANALSLGRDNVEASCREVVYLSTSAVNSLDRAHPGVVLIMHAAHIARVAAVGDSVVVVAVVVDIHCSGSSSPGLLEGTRPRTGQP